MSICIPRALCIGCLSIVYFYGKCLSVVRRIYVYSPSPLAVCRCQFDGLLQTYTSDPGSGEASSAVVPGTWYTRVICMHIDLRPTVDTCIKHKRVHHKSNIRYLISGSLRNGMFRFFCRFVVVPSIFFSPASSVCVCVGSHQQTIQSRHQ